MINLKLPMPISVNQAYAGMKRRFKSKQYKEWEKRAEQIEIDERVEGDDWLCIDYKFYVDRLYCKNGKKRTIDVANYEKVLTDHLCHRIPGFEDHKIKVVLLEKFDRGDKDPYVDITISKLDEL